MKNKRTAIQQLGELALRVNDLEPMKRFYEEVLGLEVLGTFPHAVFFKTAEGFEGHTQILALFDRETSVGPEGTTVDHFAFTIAKEDYDAERERLKGLGLDVTVSEHAWVRWRSLYFNDPEGNQVELVCYDPAVD